MTVVRNCAFLLAMMAAMTLPLAGYGQVPTQADVVVVGGGTGGFAAAVQAARMGASVVLLEEGDSLGGMYTSAGVVCFDIGPYGWHTEALATGIYGEVVARIRAHYGQPPGPGSGEKICFAPAVGRQILGQMAAELPNLIVVYGARVVDVLKTGDRVEGVAFVIGSGPPSTISADVVVDATEYGDVLALAGAAYRLGRESWAETGEDLALGGRLNGETGFDPGAAPDGQVQAATQVVVLRNMRAPMPLVAPPLDYDPNRYMDFSNPVAGYTAAGQLSRIWDLGYFLRYSAVAPPGTSTAGLDASRPETWPDLFFVNWPIYGNDYVSPAPIASLDEAGRNEQEQKAKWHALGFVRALQQHLYGTIGYNPLAIATDQYGTPDGLPPMLYVREGRRLLGAGVLAQYDLSRYQFPPGIPPRTSLSPSQRPVRGAHKWDGIALGDYPIDSHACKPFLYDYNPSHYIWGDCQMASGGLGESTVPFQVPYRCLVPLTVDGLLVADKAISVTHVANGATRLQPVVTLIGQAAGAAAALAARHGIAPRAVEVRELQEALVDSGDSLYYFSDIYPDHWAYREIQLMALAGVLAARFPDPMFPRFNDSQDKPEDQAFRPLAAITRAEVAVCIARAMHLSRCVGGSSAFDDVLPGDWEYDAVECLKKHGVMAGCKSSPPLFCPDGFVSRGQMAVILGRAKGLTPFMNPTPTFADVPPTDPIYGWVEAAFAAGLLNGLALPPYYCPSRWVNRAELAVYLFNAFYPCAPVNQPPELLTSRYARQGFVLQVAPGRQLEAWFRAFDPDSDATTVWVDPMLQGATFDPASGRFLWTPSAPGDYDVAVQASDGQAVVTQAFQIVVEPTIDFTINGGARWTRSRAVRLTIDAAGATMMCFYYEGLSTWTAWEPVAGTKDIMLASGEGNKWIFAQAKDAAGRVSSTRQVGINLDTVPPQQLELIIQEGQEQTSDQTLRLHVKAVDWLSGPGYVRFKYGLSPWTRWEEFTPYKSVARPVRRGPCTIWVQCRDRAGNVADTARDSIYILP
jgi:hypothetical protein